MENNKHVTILQTDYPTRKLVVKLATQKDEYLKCFKLQINLLQCSVYLLCVCVCVCIFVFISCSVQTSNWLEIMVSYGFK